MQHRHTHISIGRGLRIRGISPRNGSKSMRVSAYLLEPVSKSNRANEIYIPILAGRYPIPPLSVNYSPATVFVSLLTFTLARSAAVHRVSCIILCDFARSAVNLEFSLIQWRPRHRGTNCSLITPLPAKRPFFEPT